jgi:hypothetical protein
MDGRQLLHHVCRACSLITLLRRQTTDPMWCNKSTDARDHKKYPFSLGPTLRTNHRVVQIFQHALSTSHDWHVLVFAEVHQETPRQLSPSSCKPEQPLYPAISQLNPWDIHDSHVLCPWILPNLWMSVREHWPIGIDVSDEHINQTLICVFHFRYRRGRFPRNSDIRQTTALQAPDNSNLNRIHADRWPGSNWRFWSNPFLIIPNAPIITGTVFVITCHTLLTSNSRPLYLLIFSVSFVLTFEYYDIAISIS